MNKHILYKILNLQKGACINYAIISTKKSDGKFNLVLDFDESYTNSLFTDDILAKLCTVCMKLSTIYNREITQILEENPESLVPLLNFYIDCDDEGPFCGLHSSFIGENKNSHFADLEDSIINELKILNSKLDIKLEDFLNDFIDFLDKEHVYFYEFIFKKNNGWYSFYNFCRNPHRNISEQKNNVNYLLSLGIEDKLRNTVNKLNIKINNDVTMKIFKFFANNNGDIFELQISDCVKENL